jgi:hypothetical protein
MAFVVVDGQSKVAGATAGCKERKKRVSGIERTLFRRLETGYRLSKAALVVELSRSQSWFVVESDLATTQLQTAINQILYSLM